MAKSVKYTVNFLEAKEGDLHRWVAAERVPGRAPPSALRFWAPGGIWGGGGFPSSDGSALPSRIEIPFKFHMLHSGLVHGLAFWFDVAFIGSM